MDRTKRRGGAEKVQLKKKQRALKDDVAKCDKLTDIFSRGQKSTQQLDIQGKQIRFLNYDYWEYHVVSLILAFS